MRKPEGWSLEDVRRLDPAKTALVTSCSVRQKIEEIVNLKSLKRLEDVPPGVEYIIVAGGGLLLDAGKVFRVSERPSAKLIAIPTVWGSGAECTRISVSVAGDMKTARVDDALLPDGVIVIPALAASIGPSLARAGQGDAWSHAYEAFLSPLANDSLRHQIAELMLAMLGTGLGNDPAWFIHSGRAGWLQQQAGVGLIHGIAHSLEVPLSGTTQSIGHAGLCSLFLSPVHRFNETRSEKWRKLSARYGLNGEAISNAFAALHDRSRFEFLLPLLKSRWPSILREPSTRMNSAFVRREDYAFFEGLK